MEAGGAVVTATVAGTAMLVETGMAATAVDEVARTGEPKALNPTIARLPERPV